MSDGLDNVLQTNKFISQPGVTREGVRPWHPQGWIETEQEEFLIIIRHS